MDAAFESLVSKGKNTVDGVVEWMKEAKIIDNAKIMEQKVRDMLQDNASNISLDNFKEVLANLAKENNMTTEELNKKLTGTATALESAFEKLKLGGLNTADNLVKLFKDSKLIDSAKEAEETTKQFFLDAKDKANIELAQFKAALAQLVANQQAKAAGVSNMVQEEGNRMLSAFGAASSAFRDALNNKEE